MATVTGDRKAGQEAAPSPPPVTTVAFEAAMQFGGTVFGVAVTKMTLVTEDGRHFSIDLPSPAPKAGAVAALTGVCRELADEILAVLQDAGPGVVLKGIEIAARISDNTDHTDGTWGRAIKALKADGVIASAGMGSAGYCLVAAG